MVEWKELGEFAQIQKKKNKDHITENAYSITQNGLVPTNSFFKEKTRITSSDTKGYYIVEKDWFVYSPSRIDVGSINYLKDEGPVIVSPIDVVFSINKNVCLPSYLLQYFMSHNGKRDILRNRLGVEGTGRRSLPFTAIQNMVIPVPTLEEQNRIVGILDTFTDSIDNLKQQIAQRRKQYEHYRDQLLDDVSHTEKIGKLTKVFSCPRVYKSQWQDSGIPFWRSSDVMSYHNGVKNPRGEVYISQSLYEELLQKSEKIERGDILVTGGGSIGIPYLKKDNNPLFVKDADLICIKKCEGVIPSFLYHFFFSTSFRLYLKKITHDATIAHYTINQILETPIPIPPLSEQQRIVSILDTFEASISNLEAQLAQRQKQYEYYRNQLLTFE